jgi:hypothetical protein
LAISRRRAARSVAPAARGEECAAHDHRESNPAQPSDYREDGQAARRLQAALPGMELAGLEPATFWVRFGRQPTSPLAMLRHLRRSAVPDAGVFSTAS